MRLKKYQQLLVSGKQLLIDLFIEKNFASILIALVFLIFSISYFESFRWVFPGPKATHGFAKALSLVLFGLMLLDKKKNQYLVTNNLVFLLFLSSFFLSAAFSLDLASSLLHLWYPLMATLIFFVLSRVKIEKKHLYLFLFLSIAFIFLTFTFSFFSIIFRYSVDNIYYFLFLDHRLIFALEEIRQYGKYVSIGPYIILFPLTTVFLVEKKASINQKILSYFMILITILTAVISNNRIDVLVIALHFLCFAFLFSRKIFVSLLLPAMLIAAFGLLVTQTYFGFNLEERILRPQLERDKETIDMRYTYWQTALNNFRHFPIFGTGGNTYNTVSDFPIRRYYSDGTMQYTFKVDHGIGIHNVFIERLADTGLYGLITFLLLLAVFIKHDFMALTQLFYKGDNKESFKKYFLFSLSSWTWILYGITDNGYGAQGFMTFFFIRGLLPHIYKLYYDEKV
ncbi:MAG: O-antigen ligase family protein [Patescibacteria group bacterium]